ncbi:MAG: hypothetical protein WC030_03845 [Candidatus Paceibacterota bacterium]
MKSSLLHLTTAALVCAAALIGYRVWYETVVSRSLVAASIREVMDAEGAERGAATAVNTTLEELVGVEAVAEKYFVSEREAPAFISDIERRGRALGAQVAVSSVAKTGTGPDAQLALAISVRGGFDEVLRTVGAIEYAPYGLSVSTLLLTQETRGVWRAEVRIVVTAAP